METRILLGAEFDDDLRQRLSGLLKGLNGRIVSSDWGVGGSQLVETTDVEIDGLLVRIEAETYVGLTITGEERLVAKLARKLTRPARGDQNPGA